MSDYENEEGAQGPDTMDNATSMQMPIVEHLEKLEVAKS